MNCTCHPDQDAEISLEKYNGNSYSGLSTYNEYALCKKHFSQKKVRMHYLMFNIYGRVQGKVDIFPNGFYFIKITYNGHSGSIMGSKWPQWQDLSDEPSMDIMR